MRVNEVSVEKRRNENGGWGGGEIPKKTRRQAGIVRRDSQMQKSLGRFALVGGEQANHSAPAVSPSPSEVLGATSTGVRTAMSPLRAKQICDHDNIDVNYVYTEVDFAIGSQFIRHALYDCEPVADLQGNNVALQNSSPARIKRRYVACGVSVQEEMAGALTYPVASRRNEAVPRSSRDHAASLRWKWRLREQDSDGVAISLKEIQKVVDRLWAAVVERLDYLPPSKTNRVQPPAESLPISVSGNRDEQCSWSVDFLGDLPFPTSLHSSFHHHRLSRTQGETGSNPGRATPRFSNVGIVSADAAGRRVFSAGISRFPCPCIPTLLHSQLISPSSALKTSLPEPSRPSPADTGTLALPVERKNNCVLASNHLKSVWKALTTGCTRSDKYTEVIWLTRSLIGCAGKLTTGLVCQLGQSLITTVICKSVSGDIWAALNTEVMRADEGEERSGIKGRVKREIPPPKKKPRLSAALSGTIPTCDNPGVIWPEKEYRILCYLAWDKFVESPNEQLGADRAHKGCGVTVLVETFRIRVIIWHQAKLHSVMYTRASVDSPLAVAWIWSHCTAPYSKEALPRSPGVIRGNSRRRKEMEVYGIFGLLPTSRSREPVRCEARRVRCGAGIKGRGGNGRSRRKPSGTIPTAKNRERPRGGSDPVRLGP
ncbi:hypothetical protein PR048_030864 [Dryococelus australis]|uniref:Uncharacterized protein n=1 Tax=Dryococelus australis TaxID=614101 RepID=A0ABQ9GCP5_9NEOP|nr:hypothetical protein PR048_030864 [Dryococelus australis]